MHILITSWGYPEHGKKGNPFVKELGEALIRAGQKVTVIQYVYVGLLKYLQNGMKFDGLTNWLENENLKIYNSYYVNLIPNVPIFRKLIKSSILGAHRRQFKKYIKVYGLPDLIQQHYIINSQPWITELLSKEYNIPYVLFEHSPFSSLDRAEKKMGYFYTKKQLLSFVKNARLRIARTNKYKDVYESIYNAEFIAIPNFVHGDYIGSKSSDKPNDSSFVFLTIGALLPNKQQEMIIKAFISKFLNEKKVMLNLVGDGPLKKELQNCIDDLKVGHKVELLGFLKRDELFKEISRSNTIVVASKHETFGNTIIEGFMNGIPAVSTKCGLTEEIINKKNGLLCENTIDDLADKMWEMYTNYNRYDSEEIVSGCKQKYGEEVVINQILENYNQVLDI